MAMNCMRDSDMGHQDSDGVYERLWAADYADDIDLRNATPEESDLYLKKVDMSATIELKNDGTERKNHLRFGRGNIRPAIAN